MTTPLLSKLDWSDCLLSVPPQELFTMWVREAAVRTPVSRSAKLLVFVTTRTIWHLGHSAETISRSSEISRSQLFGLGSGGIFLPPCSFTIFRQPFAIVHLGS